MKKEYKFLISTVILLAILQGGLLFFHYSHLQINDQILMEHSIHRSLHLSSNFFDEAYEFVGQGFQFESGKVRAVISPHHLFVKDRIASLFKSLEKYDYDQVIMVGPDHLNDSGYDIVTSSSAWATPYGELSADSVFTEKLLQTDFVDLNERAMSEEFAISGLVSFVKKTWPEASFVPIILSDKVNQEKLDQLLTFIQNNKSDNCLLIASVDFSHYASPSEAEKQDQISNSVIAEMQTDQALTIPVDSPQSIYVTLNYALNNGANKNKLLSHTNTGVIQPWSSETAVTHNIWIFW